MNLNWQSHRIRRKCQYQNMRCTVPENESYINNLNAPIGEKARLYIQKRGLDKSTTENFRLGYSGNLKSNQYLVTCLLKEGFLLKDLLDVGLVKQNNNKNLIFYFQERIMFPIANSSGKIIAFSVVP